MRTTLSMHHIARIEGHGNISLSIEDGRVSEVKMNVVEPARLFESMVGGRPYYRMKPRFSHGCAFSPTFGINSLT